MLGALQLAKISASHRALEKSATGAHCHSSSGWPLKEKINLTLGGRDLRHLSAVGSVENHRC